jgi:hypothetical protein
MDLDNKVENGLQCVIPTRLIISEAYLPCERCVFHHVPYVILLQENSVGLPDLLIQN